MSPTIALATRQPCFHRLHGTRTGVADAVHLAGATRVHHTTVAMDVLPADSFTLVICEPWRAWRVILDSAAPARCAGHGVCSCVCACCV